MNLIQIPIYETLFNCAMLSWDSGKKQECRDILCFLIDHHWQDISQKYKNLIEDNISRIGITENSQSQILYSRRDHNLLRLKFNGSENIEKNYSQIFQDMFVLTMLNGKRNGTFLEIGGCDPFYRNNTALLEKQFGWAGISIEINKNYSDMYKDKRPNTKVINENALNLDYKTILSDKKVYNDSKIIDYLQLDIEPASNTYDCLLKIPFEEYKFAVITYEHDYYIDVTRSYREKSREYLKSKGYILVANDMSPDGKSSFEDWWIHPDLINKQILNLMIDVKVNFIKKADSYMLSPKYYSEFETDKYIRENFFYDYSYKGVMIEVGAGPPTFISASKHFRDNGWRTICIEPNPKFVKQHLEEESEVYQYACSDEEKTTSFIINHNNDEWYTSDNDGVSFSALNIRYKNIPDHNSQEIIEVSTIKLDTLLEKLNIDNIDILSIDVEGWELEVMKGFNESKYKPKVIVLENFENKTDYEIFMKERNYVKYHELGYNQIYVTKDYVPIKFDPSKFTFSNHVLKNGGKINTIIIPSELTNGTGTFNPSIYNDNGQLMAAIRHCQVTIYHSEKKVFEHEWGPLIYLHPENDWTLTTTNYFVLFNDDLSIKKIHKIDMSNFDIPPVWNFVGLEDCRLFRWNEKLYICGVRRDTTPNGEGRMELSELELTENSAKEVFRYRIPVVGPGQSYCEKNWMPVVDEPYHFVKWCTETEVVKADIENRKTIQTTLTNNLHLGFQRDLRGSSHVLPWKNGHFCITHEVDLFQSPAGRKDGRYYHRFVFWDNNWNIIKVSKEFSFMGAHVEFCAGLTKKDDNYLISFGLQDNCAFVLTCPEKIIEDIFHDR